MLLTSFSPLSFFMIVLLFSGIAFAAQGVSQFGSFSEAFTQARVAVYGALKVIRRQPGAPEETVYRTDEDDIDAPMNSTIHSKKSNAVVNSRGEPENAASTTDQPVVKAILPKFEIDTSSTDGLKPIRIQGHISFKNVTFSYPTRPHETVLNGMSTEIFAGKTVAFVGPRYDVGSRRIFSKLDCHKLQFPLTIGPLLICFDLNIYSGGGKSTVIAMLERFYDPKSGSIELDGVNVKEINVTHLRSAIGYVGQEPTLFATTIRANIQYGNPEATFEQIQEAARLANAHDFISAFSDGYDTQVGDKGSQLSGGQKQRIAIARVLVGNPRVLVLDEATSALDSESELVVQEALDNILETQKITTVIVAHRLSTIRGCDIINVLVNGAIVESGTHDELMDKQGYYRDLVVKQDGSGDGMGSKPDSAVDLQNLDDTQPPAGTVPVFEPVKISSLYPHVSFKDVIFSYPTRPKKIVFDGFNLDVERGATVALVGPSGGGKSTTVGLIERFYDPLKGTIEYEGTDIKTLNVHWYRDQIGYVGQEPTLCTYGRYVIRLYWFFLSRRRLLTHFFWCSQ
jgi:ATP-binding cassette, subfamily B (MDR/TAP), member 1